MILTDAQHETLTELINIGFARAASVLSDLTGHGLNLSVSEVALLPMDRLQESLAHFAKDGIVSVHQSFSGSVSGDTILSFNDEGAILLADLLTGEDRRVMDALGREILTEVGNILLNACLGMFGNLLKVHVTFSVPRLHLESSTALMDFLVVGHEERCYALAVCTTFGLKDSAVTGCLIIVPGAASLGLLLRAVDDRSKT